MSTQFTDYVSEWDDLVDHIATLKKQLKVFTDKEMAMRKAIAESVQAAMADQWKEGMNTYPMPDGRNLKVNHKVTRTVEVSEIGPVRAAYELLNDRPITFDELLRVKYEIDKRNLDKLEGEARNTVNRMITSKPAAPEVKLD